MLADRVERARVPPGEEDVPLVRVLVHAVRGRDDAGRALLRDRIGEAGRRAAQRLLAAEDDGLVNDVRVAAKARLPKTVTEHGYMILTGLFILEREATTESRTYAKRVEIISRYGR